MVLFLQLEIILFNTFYTLAQITIPSSVISIVNSTFSECSSLRQISIPSSVTEISHDAFRKLYYLIILLIKKITMKRYIYIMQ